MTRHQRSTIGIGAFVIMLAVAWFVWPTRYFYYEQQALSGTRLLARTDRFSGRVEFLFPGQGWVLSSADMTKAWSIRWGEMQKRYPAIKVSVLWESVRKEFIAQGFAEPWSDDVQHDADIQFNKMAEDLQRRVQDAEHGVVISECRFLRVAPVKLVGPFWKLDTPPGFAIDFPQDFTGDGDEYGVLAGKIRLPSGLTLHYPAEPSQFEPGVSPQPGVILDLPANVPMGGHVVPPWNIPRMQELPPGK